METNFDDIERFMKTDKKKGKSSAEFNDIKAKVISWLMRNGNIKKVAISAVVLVVSGLINIIICIIHNTYYMKYAFYIFILFIIGNNIRRKILKSKKKK